MWRLITIARFLVPEWTDLVFNIDLSTGTATDTPVLRIQNGNKGDFVNQDPVNQGTPQTWFRFGVIESQCVSNCWNLLPPSSRGTRLFRLFWDNGNNQADRSGYYTADPQAGPPFHELIRLHKFTGVTGTRTFNVGLEVKQPNELMDASPSYQRSITISNGDFACFSWEGLTVWKGSDQEFDASCTSIQSVTGTYMYRWQTRPGGPWTGWLTNPVYHFTHLAVADSLVTLEAKRGSGSPIPPTSKKIIVLQEQLFISGPKVVVSEVPYTYNSSATTGNGASTWFYRVPPATAWTNIGGFVSSTVIQQVWPCGSYSAQLRADASGSGVLRRARWPITVTQGQC